MHTVLVITGGLLLLAVFVAVGRWIGGSSRAAARGAVAFVPAWCVAAAINMWVGVSHAGYPFSAEAPIFVVVFGVPAAAAVFVRWMSLRAA